MENINTAYEVRVFISKLQKGDTFFLNKKKFEVVSKTKEGNLKLHIEGVGTKRLLFKYGDYYGTMGRGVDWFSNYFRDIEGVIIVDLLNLNNPFHEKSVFSKYISS